MSGPTATRSISLIHFAGRAADHNDKAMTASPILADALARRLGAQPTVVGAAEPAMSVGWREELDAARPLLEQVAHQIDQSLRDRRTPVTALSRCAVALATLPVVAAHRPDAVVVWFDAHADLNTPANTGSGYLGGMAFSGPLGLWDSGLGHGVALHNAVLVGSRDIDGPEQELIDATPLTLVPTGPAMARELGEVVAGRPVYVHVDCDVLDAGTVPTDYLVPHGMTLDDLHATAQVLAKTEVVGLEVGELESAPSHEQTSRHVTQLMDALEPLIQSIQSER